MTCKDIIKGTEDRFKCGFTDQGGKEAGIAELAHIFYAIQYYHVYLVHVLLRSHSISM